MALERLESRQADVIGECRTEVPEDVVTTTLHCTFMQIRRPGTIASILNPTLWTRRPCCSVNNPGSRAWSTCEMCCVCRMNRTVMIVVGADPE